MLCMYSYAELSFIELARRTKTFTRFLSHNLGWNGYLDSNQGYRYLLLNTVPEGVGY